MLHYFTVSNWKSIYEPVEFSMVATKEERQHSERLSCVEHSQILPVAAIYGTNASGKSVFIKALAKLQEIVLKGIEWDPIVPHLLRGADEPTKFEIEFSVEVGALNGEKREETLIYELRVDEGEVLEESLLRTRAEDEVVIFEREGNRIELYEELVGNDVAEAYAKTVGIKSNATFLGVMGDQDTERSRENIVAVARSWFSEKLHVMGPESGAQGLPVRALTDDGFAEAVGELLSWADIGIANIGFKSIPFHPLGYGLLMEAPASEDGRRVAAISGRGDVVFESDHSGQVEARRFVAIHRDSDGKEFPLSFADESDGTVRFLNLLPMLIQLQDPKSDVVFVVDELENSMHPKLTEALIRLFLSSLSTEGDSRRQLAFSTHELQLLRSDLLRRDEIWLADKVDAQTRLTRLSEFSEESVHKDVDWLGLYMSGRLGGVPKV